MRLHQLVTDAARRAPHALAVSGPDGTLSYGQLDRLAAGHARALRHSGIGPGERVVIWTGKSVEAVAVMQGALRAGVVHVPVTSANPPARVARIAADCGAALIVLDPALAHHRDAVSRAAGVPAATAAELWAAGAEKQHAPPHDNGPDDLAYILYTSGSTGDPKGVCLSHRNALAFVDWAVGLLHVTAADRLANHAPFNFDLSVFDLYAAFRAGASVHLIPPELAYAPKELVRFLHEQDLTLWYSVPSALTLMMRDGGLLDGAPPVALRACVFAGEPFPIGQVKELRAAWPAVRLLNWYGPTETNVCTSHEVTAEDLAGTAPLPIGTAASGDTVFLDPPGEEGEIVVDGPTVMLGYWGKAPHTGPYRTGDIGRLGPGGALRYAGRADHMVKLRGHRVELGEIEAVISEHPGVGDVAVLVLGSGLSARLHAVVVPAADARTTLLDLKRHCAERLPTYMIIDSLHLTDAIALTPNGKKDRAVLTAWIESRSGL